MTSPSRFLFLIALLAATLSCWEDRPQPAFETSWITAKPELLTYRTTSDRGEGFYQTSVARNANAIEMRSTLLIPGFHKTAFATMTSNLRPLSSKGTTILADRIRLETSTVFTPTGVHVTTAVAPSGQTGSADLTPKGAPIDPVQVPLLARTLPLKPGAEFIFEQVDPEAHAILPLQLRVIGEGAAQGHDCYRVEVANFEGVSIHWIEKGVNRRLIRVEQPAVHGLTELIQ